MATAHARSSISKQAGRLPADRLIFGTHPAEAALNNEKRSVSEAYTTGKLSPRLASLVQNRQIRLIEVSDRDLDRLSGGGVHQGIVLYVEPLQQPRLDEFLGSLGDGSPCLLAMLDQVTDPHNVGAVLRSAAAFGIAGLIVQSRHSPPQSRTLAKAASGGLEWVPMMETVNLARALDELKDHGFLCIGFDSDAERTLDGSFFQGDRLAMVFGAEDKGLRRLIREGCDTIVSIAAPGTIRSLNISNAAAIAFHQAFQARPISIGSVSTGL